MESKKLIVTASPHITNHTSTRGLMLNVCIAILLETKSVIRPSMTKP